MLRGVIFDIDGTLVASNDAHARSWADALSDAGFDVPFDVIWPMIGMGGDKLLPAATGIEADSVAGKRIAKHKAKIFSSNYLPHLEPTPGARDLVQRMSDDGFNLVVATSADRTQLGSLLEVAGVSHLLKLATTSSDAAKSKPDPDIVQAAVRKSGLEPERLIMLGDTPYDVQAAIGAHVNLVGLLSGGWTIAELSGATAIYDNPADVLRWYEHSPFAVEALAS